MDKPKFDPTIAAEMMAAASAKLDRGLKARRQALNPTTTKEFAIHCVRALEARIQDLFETGASVQDVLVMLTTALPTIPATELKYALRSISGTPKRLRTSSGQKTPASEVPQERPPAQTSPNSKRENRAQTRPPEPSKPAVSSPTHTIPDLPSWADGSDKRADESDDDYRLRKEVEGPPEARHKFIGEHKT
ncbi:MAG: hypothetical protein B7X10_00630 [Burkholderiales bacterium 21-58-4]|nr:MAG: hypothetical protein B7X10_00630 [Burkholderiales bacterium 21-58-4]